MIRYWLTPPEDPQREETIKTVCTLYEQAPSLAEQGERTISTDELTGVQALERKHPGLPLVPGKIERREFEYIRHGTRAFIVSRDVVTGVIVAPFCGPRPISWPICKPWSRPTEARPAGMWSVTN
ncbi:MAG TPA: hypothetical protein VFA10_06780 [Ktedonobacteraceae bacterium]|nr:hypothetical protein [Ktedonobacteraceae bacterium]